MACELGELSFSSLLCFRRSIDPNSELFCCLTLALKHLSLEPPCITDNARLTICSNNSLLQWRSGRGNCEITIFCIQGKPQYHVSIATWEQFLAHICSKPQPLSLGNLLSTRSKLRAWPSSGKAVSLACFDEAVKCFPMEPSSIKQDAQMLVECDGQVVKFISGEGSCEISVFFSKDEVPEYDIWLKNNALFLDRLRTKAVPLTLENLKMARDRMESGRLRRCFELALSEFKQEPRCIQENAKMVIRAEKETFVMCSGKGENQVTVASSPERICYRISVCGWWELGTRVLHRLYIQTLANSIEC